MRSHQRSIPKITERIHELENATKIYRQWIQDIKQSKVEEVPIILKQSLNDLVSSFRREWHLKVAEEIQQLVANIIPVQQTVAVVVPQTVPAPNNNTVDAIKIIQVLKQVGSYLNNPNLLLDEQTVRQIDNGLSLVKLQELFKFSLPEGAAEKLQTLQTKQQAYEQSYQNVRFKTAVAVEKLLATMLNQPEPTKQGAIYNQLLEWLTVELPKEAFDIEEKYRTLKIKYEKEKNPNAVLPTPTVEEQQRLALVKSLATLHLYDWKQAVATLQQLRGLSSENMMDFANYGVESFKQATWHKE